ncbi:hypothetical protein MAM1_0086d04755 [Mucor ambiguus]|uniref:Uncharacterized protein n=1 Tax=Mucor ambiguus TaxID=91626 RepID=A0A0C9LUM5_9FUNG|nr:hypothetical protein MAM1_0086d04755 [Mucor ambiguus]
MKQYNYEVLNTDEALSYWEMRNKSRNQLNTNLFHAELDAAVSSRLLAVSSSMQRKVSNITRMKRKAETPKMEADSLLFDGVSVGSTIKRHGEALAGRHKLNNKQKYVAGLCLNSIIDLSDESADSQRRFFSDEEWAMMKSKYQFSIKRNKQVFKPLFKKINKAMNNADLDKAYQSARNSEPAALNSDKEHIFNIYAHIINIYRHRRSSLNNSMNDNTELDGLVKLWAEVFESLFPDSQHNVDCRVIAIINTQKVDVLDVEAARYLQNQKTNNDHLKLAIESKGVLDHIVRHAASFDPRTDITLMLQLFAEDADSWFATLELIRTSAIKLSQQSNQPDDRSYDSHFNRKGKSKAIDYKDWLRGTFFPPDTAAADPLILPVPLYDPASNGTEPTKKQNIIF